MRTLGYQPNAGARSLRTNRASAIALVVHLEAQDDATETVPYIDGVVEIARDADYDVVLSPLREGPGGISRLAGRGICDGFVLMDVESRDIRVERLAELGVPAVLMGRPDSAHGFDVVDLNTWAVGELLVDELADTGHRRVAMIADSEEAAQRYQFIADFMAGVRTRARARGLALHEVVLADASWQSVQDAADGLFAHVGDRLGLIARTPRITQWVMNLAQLRGLVPGTDVSVVSRCTDDLAVSFAYPVTNVSPRPRELSRRAVGYLLDRLAGSEEAPRTALVQPERLVRRSTTISKW